MMQRRLKLSTVELYEDEVKFQLNQIDDEGRRIYGGYSVWQFTLGQEPQWHIGQIFIESNILEVAQAVNDMECQDKES